MTNEFSKDLKLIIYLFGIIFLDIHLWNLQLEFSPDFQSVIPVIDLVGLLAVWYLVRTDKKGLLFIPSILILFPFLALAIVLKGEILSEYYFWGHVVKALLFFAFIKVILRKDNMLSNKEDNRPVFIFFLLMLILPNLFFVLCDFTPPSWDPVRHSKNVFQIFNMLLEDKEGLFAGYMYYDLYPSISYILCFPFILLFGKSNDSLVLSVILFWLPLSFYYVRKIINEIFKVSDEHAILISFIYHSNVLFLSLYKQFLLDFQPIALLSVYYYYIWKSSFLNSRKYVVISGIILGLGFLTKQSFLLYAGPVLVFIIGKIAWDTWLNLRSNQLFYINRWHNLLLHLIIAFALIIPWFGGWQFMYSYEMSQVPAVAKMEGDPEPLTFASMVWYLPQFLYAYTWPVILILIFGWYRLLKVERFYIHKYIVGLSFLIIYIALTLNYNKDIRYISGLFFFIGFGFCGLAYIQEKYRTYVLLCSTLLCIVYSIQLVSWEKINLPGIQLTNYVLPEAPQSPAFPEEAQSLASFEKIFSEQPIPVEKKILLYKTLKEDISFNSVSLSSQRKMLNSFSPVKYDSILHNDTMSVELYRSDYNIVYGPQTNTATHYLFGRDQLYPSYYLFTFNRKGNRGLIRIAGFEGDVAADIRLVINKFSHDTLIESQEGWLISGKLEFPLNGQIDKLEVVLNVHHHLGRWQLIYLNKFTPYYKNNYITGTFVPYSSSTNENKNWIILLK